MQTPVTSFLRIAGGWGPIFEALFLGLFLAIGVPMASLLWEQ